MTREFHMAFFIIAILAFGMWFTVLVTDPSWKAFGLTLVMAAAVAWFHYLLRSEP